MASSGGRSYMMAAEANAEIVSQKLDTLLSRPEWVGCLLMVAPAKDARASLARIQEILSTQDRLFKSTDWLQRLIQVMNDAEDFLEKFQVKVARRRHMALHVATRPLAALVHKYVLWRDLSNLAKVLKELCQDLFLLDEKEAGGERKKEAARSFRASAPCVGQKLARLTYFWDRPASMNFLCHETEKEDIKERIRMESEGVHWISIWGVQGVGKTFLARWVYREAMSLGFETRAWVQVSATMDRLEVLLEILKQVDRRATDVTNLYEISEMLRQKLAQTKRFLMVLDDVRPSEELLVTLLIFINPFMRGHIITTTQDYKMAKKMESGERGPIELGELVDEESQRMLAMKLHQGHHVPGLTPEEGNILKRFPALPLCISLLGGLLSYAKEEERAALANDVSKMSVSDHLELSYRRLPVYLKPCFIYMTLFPVASPILTRRLVRLWLAEGLLDSHPYDGEREKTPEEVGKTFILELADRNVIDVVSWRADGSPKACQMLTSLYDLIRMTMRSMGFLHIHAASKLKDWNNCYPTGQQPELLAQLEEKIQIRWLAEHTNIVSDDHGSSFPYLNLSHLRSFLSFYMRRGAFSAHIGTFLRKMTSEVDYRLLRVLDLEGVFQPSLQGVLRKLVLLRYLGLRSTLLDSIPHEVADLHYLETLDIKHTNIASLPSSLWKARNLRHLHLNWFYINLKIFKAVTALTKLQTLSGLVISEVKENSRTGLMNSIFFWSNMNTLNTLTKLKLFLQHSDDDTTGAAGKTVAYWISFRLTNLKFLTFGVIQKPKLAEEAMKVDKSTEKAQTAEEGKAVGEAQTPKEAKRPQEDMKDDKPLKKAKPATSQIGPLPELSLAKHHNLLELYLLGQLDKPIWTHLLSVSLRVLTLSGSKLEADMMPELGGLLRNLRTLRLLANSFLGTRLTFAKDGFPSLKILKIWKLPLLEKVTLEEGAMLRLQELEFRHLNASTKVEGINNCEELEHICVVFKKGAQGFVDILENGIGQRKILYKIEESEKLEPKDNGDSRDEDGRDP